MNFHLAVFAFFSSFEFYNLEESWNSNYFLSAMVFALSSSFFLIYFSAASLFLTICWISAIFLYSLWATPK